MARKPKADKANTHNITTEEGRGALPTRKAPYWSKLYPNHFVGYRRMSANRPGTWVAKIQRQGGETGQPLGHLLEVPVGERYATAVKMANKWFESNGTIAVSAEKVTLQQALQAYVTHVGAKVRTKGGKPTTGQEAANNTARRFAFLFGEYKDKEGRMLLERPVLRITEADWKAWRKWLEAEPTMASARVKGGGKRKASSVNRDCSMVRAALNLAHKEHKLPVVWKEAFERDASEDIDASRGEWAVLTMEQRRLVLTKCEELAPAILPFIKALLTVPLRPGALALCTVADYKPAKHALHIKWDKARPNRMVPLPKDADTVALFKAATRGKTPAAPLFADEDGAAWDAESWSERMREVCRAVKLRDVSIYCLRHTRITDLVELGMDPLSIAAIAGTSVQQIQDHYFKLRSEHAERYTSVRGY